jgi:hypothetical protein
MAVFNGKAPAPKDLPGVGPKKRKGFIGSWNAGKIKVTYVVEIVPSKGTPEQAKSGEKRKTDCARMIYTLENTDNVAHKVEFRTQMDMYVVDNDGALYAAPTIPDQVLNGIVLKDKTLPEYVKCLQRPDLKNPGFTSTMTIKNGKYESASRVVLTNLGAVFSGGWDIPAQMAGDSAAAIFWDAKELKPGEKRVMAWSYGGGIASDPDSEGVVSLKLTGSLLPNKIFTVTATVDDPMPNQTLRLELPAGMELVEGKATQAVPLPSEIGVSVVMWKARTTQLGEHNLRVHSTSGSVTTTTVVLEKASK